MRWLCGGFNPNDPIFTKLNIETAYRRVAGNIGTRTRLDYSESLGAAARQTADFECGVDLVSAFNDERWDRLYDGWELEERKYREEQRLLWQAALADVLAQHPLDGSARSKEVQDYEVEELRKRWAARLRCDRGQFGAGHERTRDDDGHRVSAATQLTKMQRRACLHKGTSSWTIETLETQ